MMIPTTRSPLRSGGAQPVRAQPARIGIPLPIALLILPALLLAPTSVRGQAGPGLADSLASTESTPVATSTDLPSLDQVAATRESVVAEIEGWGARMTEVGATWPEGTEPSEHRRTVVGLAMVVIEKLDAQAGILRRIEEITAQEERRLAVISNVSSLVESTEAPIGFEILDPVLLRRDSVELALELGQAEMLDAERGARDARRQERTRQQERRRFEEAARQAEGTVEEASARRKALEASWRARVASEDLRLEELRLKAYRESVNTGEKELEALRLKVQLGRRKLGVSPQSLQSVLDALAGEARETRELLAEVESELENARTRWNAAQGRPIDPGEEERWNAEIRYWRTLLDLREQERQIHVGMLDVLTLEGEIWTLRHLAAGLGAQIGTSDPGLELGPSLDPAHLEAPRGTRLERLETLNRDLERLQRAAQRRIEELGSLLLESEQPRERGKEERREARAVRETLDRAESLLTRVRAALSLSRWTQEETGREQEAVSELVDQAGNSFRQIWQMELISIEDRPITLGKVLVALLLVFLGYLVSKRLSASIGRLLTQRFSVSSGVSHALQNLAFYVLLLIFFLWGFQLVGIPLTVFTLLGGVVAIGLGFGSQNIVNNFISGLILLIERPIRVGDLIDVDGVLGTIENIGLRSTRIRSGNNVRIFVPNSAFLEKSVHNWTSSDENVRSSMDVGVAYGSPVETVRELIEKALEEEPLVLKHPAPEVLFRDFGNSSLDFRAYFWLRVRQGLDTERAQSAIRFRVDAAFAESELVIPFPQRDVHLDSLAPVQVELLDRRRRAEEEEHALADDPPGNNTR